jgi:hypothetical protein
MARIETTPQSLIVYITGLDRMLTFRGSLEVPMANVLSVEYNPQDTQRELDAFWNETFIPGAVAPGKSLVGTFTEHGDRIFWDVHHADRAVTVNLTHHRYAKVIVEVANPEQTVREIQEAMSVKSPVLVR